MTPEILRHFVRTLIEHVYDANAQLGDQERPLPAVRKEALTRLENGAKEAQYLVDMPLFTDSQRLLLDFSEGNDEVAQILPLREQDINVPGGEWVGGSVFVLTNVPLVHLSSILPNDAIWWMSWVLWCKHGHTLFIRRTGPIPQYRHHLCVVMRRSMMM